MPPPSSFIQPIWISRPPIGVGREKNIFRVWFNVKNHVFIILFSLPSGNIVDHFTPRPWWQASYSSCYEKVSLVHWSAGPGPGAPYWGSQEKLPGGRTPARGRARRRSQSRRDLGSSSRVRDSSNRRTRSKNGVLIKKTTVPASPRSCIYRVIMIPAQQYSSSGPGTRHSSFALILNKIYF